MRIQWPKSRRSNRRQQEALAERERNFVLDGVNVSSQHLTFSRKTMDGYNALNDAHCRHYFRSPSVHRLLLRMSAPLPKYLQCKQLSHASLKVSLSTQAVVTCHP